MDTATRTATETRTTVEYRPLTADIKILTQVATDPNDLLWRNLQNSNLNILSRQIVIGTFSFLYLLGLGVIMGFFAAHSREYQKFGTLVNLGLLGVLGNVLCCVTSIVIFMPIISTFEGEYSKLKNQIVEILVNCVHYTRL